MRKTERAYIDLVELARRIADRSVGRSEATLQADIHALLLAGASLNLQPGDLEDITSSLEVQAGHLRRIDIEVGCAVIEVKRRLDAGSVRERAMSQLATYLGLRTAALGQRFVGILTDGHEWELYNLTSEGEVVLVSGFSLEVEQPDIDGLLSWLEVILATSERLIPTPLEIRRILGSSSPAYELDYRDLLAIYETNCGRPTVHLKRELWAKLLVTASGTNFPDTDELFVNHTLLVATAEIIAHAALGYEVTELTASELLSGGRFARARIRGVVEQDFFDWILEVDGGERWVRSLSRRIARFDWSDVQHDVMKVLYESIISQETRHRLGEYYTPDWLARLIVNDRITHPHSTVALDPACGSGTFLFHAVRLYLDDAEKRGVEIGEAIRGVTECVIGVDVHPVAVTLARVTYLLAIGTERLISPSRPDFSVPVYLGDSLQWRREDGILSHNQLAIPTYADIDERARETAYLRFPQSLLDSASLFDGLVGELADKATERVKGGEIPSISTILDRHGVREPSEREMIITTFDAMCRLHDDDRDHVWSYYVRNLARPAWLTQPRNRVDMLIGNPPWLAYRFMTHQMQATFRELSVQRKLWAGQRVATNQDLSALFVARCVELYLRAGGKFGFVMPWSVLRSKQYAGFREGWWPGDLERTAVQFSTPWDMHAVKPTFFPVPCCVMFGERVGDQEGGHRSVPSVIDAWSGRLPQTEAPFEEIMGPTQSYRRSGPTAPRV